MYAAYAAVGDGDDGGAAADPDADFGLSVFSGSGIPQPPLNTGLTPNPNIDPPYPILSGNLGLSSTVGSAAPGTAQEMNGMYNGMHNGMHNLAAAAVAELQAAKAKGKGKANFKKPIIRSKKSIGIAKEKSRLLAVQKRDNHRRLANKSMYLMRMLRDNNLMPGSFDFDRLVFDTFPIKNTVRKNQQTPPNIDRLLHDMSTAIEYNAAGSEIPGIANPQWGGEADIDPTIPYESSAVRGTRVTDDEQIRFMEYVEMERMYE